MMYEYAVAYEDGPFDSAGNPVFTILATTSMDSYELPPTTRRSAIYRVASISFNVRSAYAYSIVSGFHQLDRFASILTLAVEDLTIVYTDDKPPKPTTTVTAVLDLTNLSTILYAWYIDGVLLPTQTASTWDYQLPAPRGNARSVTIRVDVTDSVDLLLRYSDEIVLQLVATTDSVPLFKLRDEMLLVELASYQANLPWNVEIDYLVKGVATALPAYTITAVGCTVIPTLTGVSITAILATAPYHTFTVTAANGLVTKGTIVLYSKSPNVSAIELKGTRQAIPYSTTNSLITANDSVDFVANLMFGNPLDHVFQFSIDGVVVQTGTSQNYTYLAPASYTDMPQRIKVIALTMGLPVAADTVQMIGIQAGSTAIAIHLDNPFHGLPSEPGFGVSMAGSGTELQVYLGQTELTYATGSVPTVNGTYTVVAQAIGLTGPPTAPLIATTGQKGCHTADYPLPQAVTTTAKVIFSVTVKDFLGATLNPPAVIQNLIVQSTVNLTAAQLALLDTLAITTSGDSTPIVAPTFTNYPGPPVTVAFAYDPDADANGTTDGTISWEYGNVAALGISGFVVSYSSNSNNAQNDLSADDILRSGNKTISNNAARHVRHAALGTSRFQCAFIFAYREVTSAAYGIAVSKMMSPDNKFWVISPVTRSHTTGALSQYVDRLVIGADFKDAAGNILKISDMTAAVADFNAGNNSSTLMLPPPVFAVAPSDLVYDATKVNSGNIDFLVNFTLTNTALTPITDVDGIAVLEVTTLNNGVALPTLTAQKIIEALPTIFVKASSTVAVAGDVSAYRAAYDEAKALVFRNVYLVSYREITKTTYGKISPTLGATKFIVNKTRYFLASPVVALKSPLSFSQYTDILTTTANLVLPDGTMVSTADVYENVQDFNSKNNTSAVAIQIPTFTGVDAITYLPGQSNSGNIDYTLAFKHTNALNAVVDSIDGFAILEVTSPTYVETMPALTAQKVFDNPATKFVDALDTPNSAPDTLLSRTYYVSMEESKGLAYRSVYIVAYRNVTVKVGKLAVGSKVLHKKQTYICSPVLGTPVSYYAGPLYSQVTLKTASGQTVSTEALYENALDFNSKNDSAVNILSTLITGAMLSYDVAVEYPSGNVDIVLSFNYIEPSDLSNANAIDGFIVGLLDSKVQGNITLPAPTKLVADLNMKFTPLLDDTTTYDVVFKNVSPIVFRTAVIAPYRTVGVSKYAMYPLAPTTTATKGVKAKFQKLNFCLPKTATRSHLDGVLYQAQTAAIMKASVAIGDKTFALNDVIGDFNLGNVGLLADVTSLVNVTYPATNAISFEGNSDGTVDVVFMWDYPVASEGLLDGFLIDYVTDKKASIALPTYAKIKGYATVDEATRTFRLKSQPITAVPLYYNFTVIPYHALSMAAAKKNKTNPAVVVTAPPLIHATGYGLGATLGIAYTRADAQGATAPVAPRKGDYWLNTSAGMLMGIPTFETGIYNGTDWEVLTTAEATKHGVTQIYVSAVEPPNKPGFSWTNSSGTNVSGIKANDTVRYDIALDAWVSINPKSLYSFKLGPPSAMPTTPREGDLYLAITSLVGTASLYTARNGSWTANPETFTMTASAATSQVGATAPKNAKSNPTLTVLLVLAGKLPTTVPTVAVGQLAPTIYRRTKLANPWKPVGAYESKTLVSTTLPTKMAYSKT
jgi:hypothetical protein